MQSNIAGLGPPGFQRVMLGFMPRGQAGRF
jgi:hypothetical protein